MCCSGSRRWSLLVWAVALAGCAASAPEPEPPPPPASEAGSGEAAGEGAPETPPAPEATPPAPAATPPAPEAQAPARLPEVALAPPAAEAAPEAAPTRPPSPAPPRPGAPVAGAPSTLEAAVPDLEELRQDLLFVDEVPPLSLPLDGAPGSLAPPGAASGEEALFARLVDAWLGGELDAAGDEEVRVEVSQGEREAVLAARTLDLESELRGIPFPDAPWVELAWPGGGELELELLVLEEDETEDEVMTGTDAPFRVRVEQLGREEEPRQVRLNPITGTEVRLFGPNRELRLEGAKATLGLVRVARRAAPDAAARELIAQAFAPLLAAAPAGDAAAALALARAAGEAGDAAMSRAARSTDTWVRGEVPPLAAEARRLAIVAAAVAQADPAVVRGAQVALARVLADLPPGEARRPEAQEPLSTARSLAEPLLEALEREELLRGAALAEAAAGQLLEVAAADEEGSSELGAVAQALSGLEALLRRAARGLELGPVLRQGREALTARLRSD